jgi:hypothetical protein
MLERPIRDKTLAYYQHNINYSLKKFYDIDTCDQFHKTFFGVIYAAIGILPYVFTQVMPLGV